MKKMSTDENLRPYLILIVLGLLVYWGILSAPFVYDDHFFVKGNPHIRDLSADFLYKCFFKPAEVAASLKWDDIYRQAITGNSPPQHDGN